MNGTSLKINKYLPIAIIYFFLNSFLLPQGILYTSLLTPILIIWLIRYPSFHYIWLFFLISAPFLMVHLWNGVNIKQYLLSYVSLFTVFVFCLCFYQFLRECHSLGNLFKSLILINFALVLVAMIAFYVPVMKDIFWLQTNITNNFERTYRLKMLTYEASYYSLLLAPIALFYYLRMIMQRYPDKWLTLLLITLPLLLSLSFGVIAGLILSIFLIFCSDIRLFSLSDKMPGYIISGLALLIIASLFIWKLYPENIIFVRIANVFQGQDTSFRGRTFDSIYLGWQLASEKSILFGIGPGQVKVIGLDIFVKFYKWEGFTSNSIAIPNSIGDTLAVFGIIGVLLKLSLEAYFFFKTEVYTNFYRLALFLFIFIYQFTGSFITNIAEYVIWIMAFYPSLFPEFDKKKIFGDRLVLKA